MAVPNPEQTASIFSMAVFSFLDPVVFLAYRVPHLAHDQLPPLADYDYARHLIKNSFPVCILLADPDNVSHHGLIHSTSTHMLASGRGISSSDLCASSERNIPFLQRPSSYKFSLALPLRWASSNYLGLLFSVIVRSTAEYYNRVVDTSKRMAKTRSSVHGSG